MTNNSNSDFLEKLILMDQIVALPTDTVFGLIANAKSEAAIENLFNLKNREKNKAFAVFVNSFAMLDEIANASDEAKILLKNYPNLTLILSQKEKSGLAKNLNNKLGTIAIRIPNVPFILEVIAHLGFPLAATSANISGEKILNNKKDILDKFGDKIAFVADFELIPKKPSTIVDLVNYKIIREGDVSKEEIEKVMKCKIS